MARLTRGERFKDARIEHNKNKKQTMDEVANATGICKSLIQSLEDDSVHRSVGYDKIAKLASHYGVTSDYLLGLSDNPFPNGCAVDDLGISPKAVEWIELFVKNDDACFDHDDTASVFNLLLEDVSFTVFYHELCSFFNAKRAEYIYESLLTQAFPIEKDGSRVIPREKLVEFNRKVNDALKNTAFPEVIPDNAKRADYLSYDIADYLQAILELEDSEPGDSDFIDALTGLYGLQISELPDLRARKAFDRLMRTLDRHAEKAGEFENIPKCLTEAMR